MLRRKMNEIEQTAFDLEAGKYWSYSAAVYVPV